MVDIEKLIVYNNLPNTKEEIENYILKKYTKE